VVNANLVFRRGETVAATKHHIGYYNTTGPYVMNEVFFDPTSNTQIHVSDQSISNTWITYPYITFYDKVTSGTEPYLL
jgi:hypothetical protein